MFLDESFLLQQRYFNLYNLYSFELILIKYIGHNWQNLFNVKLTSVQYLSTVNLPHQTLLSKFH